MIKATLARLQQKHRTMKYPDGAPPPLPDRFRGRPLFDLAQCPPDCRACFDACPSRALDPKEPARLDLGKCLFCTECANACPRHAVTHSAGYQLAARSRGDLVVARDGQAVEAAGARQRRAHARRHAGARPRATGARRRRQGQGRVRG